MNKKDLLAMAANKRLRHFVLCHHCKAQTEYFSTKEKAIRGWNKGERKRR